MNRPSGIVTFLFTDIEGSTRLWELHGASMAAALARHDAIVRGAVAAHGGEVFKHTGDGMCTVFATAPDAVRAALEAQRALQRQPWGEIGALRVRMALHTGTAEVRSEDYYGPTLNRCARLLAAAHGGQVLLALSTAELIRDALPDDAALIDLGAHRLRDIEHAERIVQLTHPELPVTFPPLRAASHRPHELPVQLTSFVGRVRELVAVLELLDTSRLVTLTGIGGCGKTRLALQATAQRLSRYPEGVYVAELAAITDESLVIREVAALFSVCDTQSAVVSHALEERLVDSLAGRHILLVLDNCEHLLRACAAVVETLLQGCPDLTILATSREALGCAGERVWQVPSLSATDAAQLFVDRASALPFAPEPQHVDAVEQLCRRLDGIPLAIELAAARVRHLSPQQVLDRLDDRFRVLTGGRRTALPRQQTLQATMDWSHDLLSERERVLFGRLAVFAGGFTVEAAEAVCTGGALDPGEILELLGHLVDKSLIVINAERGAARYLLLETVRQYAAQKLAESTDAGESDTARRRHRDWFLALAREAAPRIMPDQRTWLPRLQVEHDNLRAALEWSLDAGDGDSLARLSAALLGFWLSAGYVAEGSRWADAAVRLSAASPPTLRAQVLDVAGQCAQIQGDYDRALACHEQALAVWRQVGSERGGAWALFGIGRVHLFRGDRVRGVPAMREALALHLAHGDLVGAAWSVIGTGNLGYAVDTERAAEDIATNQEGARLARAAGYEALAALCTVYVGRSTALLGDLARAVALCNEAMEMLDTVHERFVVLWALPSAAGVSLMAGDATRAANLLRRGIALTRETGAFEALPDALETTAALRSRQGSWAAAARLWGAAEAVRRQVRVAAELHAFRAVEAVHRDAARRALGPETFERELAAGQGFSVREAVALALGELSGAAHD